MKASCTRMTHQQDPYEVQTLAKNCLVKKVEITICINIWSGQTIRVDEARCIKVLFHHQALFWIPKKQKFNLTMKTQ